MTTTTTLVTLHFIREGTSNDETTDDVLKVVNTTFHRNFRITFSPGDGHRRYESYMTDTRVYDHLQSILVSLTNDDVPFERLQVTTALQPSCMYHISQLSDSSVRHNILEAVWTVLRQPITSEIREADPEEDDEDDEDADADDEEEY